MTQRRWDVRGLALGLMFVVSAAGARAQQPEEAAVRSVVQRYMDARERRDAAALDALFTRDADQHTTGGAWRRGASHVVPGSLESSAQNAGRRTIAVEAVRFLTPDVAIADGPYVIDPGNGAAVRRMWTTIVLKRESGVWKIAAIRNMVPTS